MPLNVNKHKQHNKTRVLKGVKMSRTYFLCESRNITTRTKNVNPIIGYKQHEPQNFKTGRDVKKQET